MGVNYCLGTFALGLGILGTAAVSHAALYAYDNFTYASGTDLGGEGDWTSGTSPTGWTGNWISQYGSSNDGTITSGSLSSPNANESSSGNAVLLSGYTATSGSPIDYRYFAPTPTANNTSVFISFLVDPTELTSRGIYLSLYTGTNVNEVVSFGTNGTSWGVSIPNTMYYGTTGFTAASGGAPAPAANTTVLLVGELDYGSSGLDGIELYVDPTGTTAPTPNVSLTSGFTSTAPVLDEVNLYAGYNTTGSPSNGASAIFDEIRIGSTFADVVPEPTALAILGLPAMAGLIRRRRAANS